jgi:hypothetical protein
MDMEPKLNDCISPVFSPHIPVALPETEFILNSDDETLMPCFMEPPCRRAELDLTIGSADTVLYMGKAFAVLTKKDSKSSKYRGCELQKCNPLPTYDSSTDSETEEPTTVFRIRRYSRTQVAEQRDRAIEAMLAYED